MKAKKLPSGNWRVQLYYKDKAGKIYRPSFTAATKQEAEMQAAKFEYDIEHRLVDDLTVAQAVDNYINSNSNALSPSTIYNYKKDAKRLEPIKNIRIKKLTSNDIQLFISELISKDLSPKTIRNTYALLRASLTYSGIDRKFMIHLPAQKKTPRNAPENEQIAALYNAASKHMKVAIMLAAFHSLRRGEIAGLKYGDLKGNTLYVHSDVVTNGKEWVHKQIPKTDTSNRTIYLTDQELELIGHGNKNDYIVPLAPSTIGSDFYKLKKKLGIEGVRFHDLRVYFASISAVAGIPEIVTAHHGGWKEGSPTLRNHYRKPIASIDQGYANKLNNYFENVITTHETTHGNCETAQPSGL